MGFSKKSQMVDGCLESDGKKWVIAGISVRASLKAVRTKPKRANKQSEEGSGDEVEDGSTTPTTKEARIPEIFSCPPAPRKRRTAPAVCNFSGVREYFIPPDLETVFKLHVEKA